MESRRAKAAIADLLRVLRDCRFKSAWAHCPSIPSVDILRAFEDPCRDNTPRAAQLLEVDRYVGQIIDSLGESRRLIRDVLGAHAPEFSESINSDENNGERSYDIPLSDAYARAREAVSEC